MSLCFQAEDGIRDYKVTGVQTCALPISELGEGGGVVALAAQGHAEKHVRGGESGLEAEGLAKFSGGGIEIAELAFGEAELEMNVGRRFGGEGAAELGFGGGEIILLGIDAGEEATRADVGGVEVDSGTKLVESRGLIVQVVTGCAETVMRIGPIGFEAEGGLEFVGGLVGVTFIFEC